MRKFSEYLTEQEAIQAPMMPGAGEEDMEAPEPGTEAEEPDEFDVRNMPRNPGEKRLTSKLLKYVDWLTQLPVPQSIGTKKAIMHAIIAWLGVPDISTLNRIERPERSSLIKSPPETGL
jgi:hypothetical protein